MVYDDVCDDESWQFDTENVQIIEMVCSMCLII